MKTGTNILVQNPHGNKHICNESFKTPSATATDANRLDRLTYSMKYKMLSYRRETALQGTLVWAESGILELRDNILLIL